MSAASTRGLLLRLQVRLPKIHALHVGHGTIDTQHIVVALTQILNKEVSNPCLINKTGPILQSDYMPHPLIRKITPHGFAKTKKVLRIST